MARAGREFAEQAETYLLGRWQDRHPLNVPGPFYGAATDTCCDGPALSPKSLLYDLRRYLYFLDNGGYPCQQPQAFRPSEKNAV